MKSIVSAEHGHAMPGIRQWVACIAFLALAAYLWFVYQAPLAVLPLGLALACPLAAFLRKPHAHREPTR